MECTLVECSSFKTLTHLRNSYTGPLKRSSEVRTSRKKTKKGDSAANNIHNNNNNNSTNHHNRSVTWNHNENKSNNNNNNGNDNILNMTSTSTSTAICDAKLLDKSVEEELDNLTALLTSAFEGIDDLDDVGDVDVADVCDMKESAAKDVAAGTLKDHVNIKSPGISIASSVVVFENLLISAKFRFRGMPRLLMPVIQEYVT